MSPAEPVRLFGRSSSHYTRVAAIFALELGVPVVRETVADLASLEAARYGDNPALKIPTLRVGSSLLVGTENICRRLAELAPPPRRRVVWPEQLAADVARCAQELVWHGMATQVNVVLATLLGKLPPQNPFVEKLRTSLTGTLEWLDQHLASALAELPEGRDLSLLEVTLHCLVDHFTLRPTVDLGPYGRLRAFAEHFGARPSAELTPYRFDPPAPAPRKESP